MNTGESKFLSQYVCQFQLKKKSKQITVINKFKMLKEVNDNVKVIIRIRPPLTRQVSGQIFITTTQVSQDKKQVQLYEYYNLDDIDPETIHHYIDNPHNYSRHQFTFDYVYDEESNQEEIYKNTARISVCSSLEGYNATIFAYGQTGTGKTYTMEGFKYDMGDPERGIIPRAIEDIFKHIETCENQETTFMVRASYIQIYNEVISDLLKNQKKTLQIRQDPKRGVYIQGASQWAVVKPRDILQLMKLGTKSRATAKTNMNESSSRSHAIFVITIQQMRQNPNQDFKEIKVGKLNLVDLAGSQRVRVTGASGKRLDECKNINKSLSCLGMVIAALTDTTTKITHIPYRNSALTRLLSDSLGGNCKTTMFTMISPAPEAFQQSLSSLKFAYRAKSIKNKPLINQDCDQRALIRKYENEISKLKSQLDSKNKILIDKSKLIQLQEQKRRIEEDKNKVIIALEQRSTEFFKEREEKKLLQQKIKAFNSQLIHTGHGTSYEKSIQQQQRLIRQYENKIKTLESSSDKALMNTELFQKQNSILMNLAERLNERDEVNNHLNEELCAYDKITKQTEMILEKKKIRIDQLEKILKKNKISFPVEEEGYIYNNREENMDQGVFLEGEMTYNITQKNLVKSQEEISALKSVNTNQKHEIYRLKEELQKKDSQRKTTPLSSEKTSQSKGYKLIKESIDLITKGLQSKENTDMKAIVGEIFKIKRVCQQY